MMKKLLLPTMLIFALNTIDGAQTNQKKAPPYNDHPPYNFHGEIDKTDIYAIPLDSSEEEEREEMEELEDQEKAMKKERRKVE